MTPAGKTHGRVSTALTKEAPRDYGVRLMPPITDSSDTALAMAVWACQEAKGGVSRVRFIRWTTGPSREAFKSSDYEEPGQLVTVAQQQKLASE